MKYPKTLAPWLLAILLATPALGGNAIRIHVNGVGGGPGGSDRR
jgi:hypothetical protein